MVLNLDAFTRDSSLPNLSDTIVIIKFELSFFLNSHIPCAFDTLEIVPGEGYFCHMYT